MRRQQRRRSLRERRSKVFDAAGGFTLICLAIGVFYFASGGPGGKSGFSNSVIFVISFLVAIAAWWWTIHTVRAQNAAGKTLQELQSLTPDVFEDWVAARFRDLGFTTRVTGTHGDHGVDLVAEKSGDIAVVQCKNYKAWSVGEPALRDLFGAMHDFGAKRAYLVTTGKLTRPAEDWVRGKPIEIWDGAYLARLSKQLTPLGRNTTQKNARPTVLSSDGLAGTIDVATNPVQRATTNSISACPMCGSQLVEKRNRRTGELFLACPRFPACRYTRPIPS